MEQAQGSQRWTARKILIGAGIGCGALILLFVIVAFSAGYYFYMPGDQIATTRILDRDSAAVFRLENLGKDGGVGALLDTIMEEAHRLDRERKKDLPEFARWLADFQRGYSSQDAEKMKTFLPREVTVTLEQVPGSDDPEPIFAINLSRFPRLIRFIFWMGKDKVETKEDEFTIDFVESTMLGGRRSVLERTVSRMNHPEAADEPDPELLEAYKSGDPRWDFHGVALNRGNIWGRLLEKGPPTAEEDPPAEKAEDYFQFIRKFTFGIDIVSAEEAEGEVVLDCLDEAKAVELLKKVADDWRTQLRDAGFNADVSIERRDRFVTLRVKVDNLKDAIIASFRAASGHSGEEPTAEEPAR